MSKIIQAIVDIIKSIFESKPAPIEPPVVEKPVEAPVIPEVAKPSKMMPIMDALKICIKPYENLRESNGKNRSALIDQIIKNQKGALGSAYCAYGASQLMDDVVSLYASQGVKVKIDVPRTGSSQAMWGNAKAEYKVGQPKPASIVIWKHMSGSYTGHVGTCLSFLDKGEFKTFEFNTSGPSSSVVRDGEGAYYKSRPFKDVGDMHILGFIDLEKAMKVL